MRAICEEAQCRPVLSAVRGRGRAGKLRDLEFSREAVFTHAINITFKLKELAIS